MRSTASNEFRYSQGMSQLPMEVLPLMKHAAFARLRLAGLLASSARHKRGRLHGLAAVLGSVGFSGWKKVELVLWRRLLSFVSSSPAEKMLLNLRV